MATQEDLSNWVKRIEALIEESASKGERSYSIDFSTDMGDQDPRGDILFNEIYYSESPRAPKGFYVWMLQNKKQRAQCATQQSADIFDDLVQDCVRNTMLQCANAWNGTHPTIPMKEDDYRADTIVIEWAKKFKLATDE